MEPKSPRGMPRWPFAVLAYLLVGLAMVGVVLPGLPTVPFLLLAAWSAARGSERLHQWLHEHPRFGRDLRAWRDERAVSGRAKATAVITLAASWLLLLWRVGRGPLLVALAALFVTVAAFLLTRPAPGPGPFDGGEV